MVRDGVRYRKLPVGWAGPRGGQLLFHALLPFAARRIPHDLWIESFTPPFSTSFLPLFSRARVVGFAQSLSGEEMWGRYRLPFFLVERFGLRFYRDVVVLNQADCARGPPLQPVGHGAGHPEWHRSAAALTSGCSAAVSTSCSWAGSTSWRRDWTCCSRRTKGAGWPCRCSIAGSGTRREERKFAALLAATSGDVRWVGHVTGQHKQELLESSAFVVLPSRHETFGLAALEGMSYGKPVVHFDLPALRWMDGDVRVPPFDVSALAGEMRDLAGDEAARRELGRTAHAAAQRYGRDETADRYLRACPELLNAPSAGTQPECDPACQ